MKAGRGTECNGPLLRFCSSAAEGKQRKCVCWRKNGKHGVKIDNKEYVVFINFLLILNYRVPPKAGNKEKTSGVVELIQQLTRKQERVQEGVLILERHLERFQLWCLLSFFFVPF